MSSKEIVTLQIGHFSNFVGTHWWNTQESSFVYGNDQQCVQDKEVNHDILFREGQTLRGQVTYTPRLIAVDLKGSLNFLKEEGSLYEDGKQEDWDEVKWAGDVTLHKKESKQKNKFLADLDKEEKKLLKCGENDHSSDDPDSEDKDIERAPHNGEAEAGSTDVFGKKLYQLDDSVQVWSDFLRTHLHPKSVSIIEQHTHGNELSPFDIYGCGLGVWEDYDTRNAFEDRIHYFVEECDNLQGFNIICDTYDGFGGFSASALEYLHDEFSSKGRLTFAVTPNDLDDSTAGKRANRILNTILSYPNCWSHCSLFVPVCLRTSLWRTLGPPISFPYLDYKNIPYHTSAILASALDTATLPFRSVAPCSLRDITDTLADHGKLVGSLQTRMPFCMQEGEDFIGHLLSAGGKALWTCISPHINPDIAPYSQAVVCRGLSKSLLECSKSTEARLYPSHLSSCTSINEVMQLYLSEKYSSSLSVSQSYGVPLKTVQPFPHIFHKNLTRNGFLGRVERKSEESVESVPMITSLQSSMAVCGMLDSLHAEGSKFNFKKHHKYIESGIDEDSFKETLDQIQSLKTSYT